jgi:F0F1-type ATP synthase assembly protein I
MTEEPTRHREEDDLSGQDGEKRESPEETRQERQKMLELSAVGLAFPIAIAIGYFFGRTVGSWWDHPGAGGLVGVLLGVAAGFHNLLRAAGRMGG